jgi:hypothetical protein
LSLLFDISWQRRIWWRIRARRIDRRPQPHRDPAIDQRLSDLCLIIRVETARRAPVATKIDAVFLSNSEKIAPGAGVTLGKLVCQRINAGSKLCDYLPSFPVWSVQRPFQ